MFLLEGEKKLGLNSNFEDIFEKDSINKGVKTSTKETAERVNPEENRSDRTFWLGYTR